jgi:oligopeptide/dipeptide ABC transporter ATP-binding protein
MKRKPSKSERAKLNRERREAALNPPPPTPKPPPASVAPPVPQTPSAPVTAKPPPVPAAPRVVSSTFAAAPASMPAPSPAAAAAPARRATAEASAEGGDLLEVSGLKVHFPIQKGLFSRVVGHVKAVDGVDLRVGRSRTLGLVGESGCGKTTVGRAILRLIPPTAGSVRFDGRDVLSLESGEMRRLRRRMQIIFQDPVGSLNPRMTVGQIIGEGLTIHGIASGSERRDIVAGLLEKVGLSASVVNRYPHEFSGGQRQRIGIARAVALKPDFIVCDEPVSALDVSIQSQILNLLSDLQDEFGIAYLFIAHNLAVVEHFSDDVAVMYLGRVAERASSDALYRDAMHPYTRALLSAIPVPDPDAKSNRIVLGGEVPSPARPPSGCTFHPRCPEARRGVCDTFVPRLEPAPGDPSHTVSCWARATALRPAWDTSTAERVSNPIAV